MKRVKMAGKKQTIQKIHTVGRRKSAVARVYMAEGKGSVEVNGKDIKDYFGPTTSYPAVSVMPLTLVEMASNFDVRVVVKGGGLTGQSDAISLAIARALCLYELKLLPADAVEVSEEADEATGDDVVATTRPIKALLKLNKMLTRDSRAVERKKYGFRKARKKEQYSKR